MCKHVHIVLILILLIPCDRQILERLNFVFVIWYEITGLFSLGFSQASYFDEISADSPGDDEPLSERTDVVEMKISLKSAAIKAVQRVMS